MAKRKRYDCKVYLGKELYEKMTQQADTMGVSLATYLRISINVGAEFARTIERGLKYGNK